MTQPTEAAAQMTAQELQAEIMEVEARAQIIDRHAFATFTVWPTRFTITVHPGAGHTRLDAQGKTPEEAFAALHKKLDESDPALLAADFAGAPVYGP